MIDNDYPIGALFLVSWTDGTHNNSRRWALYVRADDGGYDCLIDATRSRARPRDRLARSHYPTGRTRQAVPDELEPAVRMLLRHNQIDKACKLVGDPWRNRSDEDG